MSDQTTAAMGRAFGNYRIEAELGRGGMGVVYLAADLRLDRKVALKVLAPELGGDDRFRGRFLRESRTAAAIDHPGIIPVYEAGDVDGQLYIAMRYVEGTDLQRLLQKEGRLPPDRAVALVEQVAVALDAAHAGGLVHRDVKPSNALVAAGDHVYLCDFGLTRQTAGGLTFTAPDEIAGTALYMAPETLRSGTADARSDLYSLACTLFECLTGTPPFNGPTQAAVIFGHLEEPPPKASERRPDLPRALDPVLARALETDPARRYGSGAELMEAARTALAGRRPPRQRRGRRLALAGAALVAVAGAAAVALRPTDSPQKVTIRGDAVGMIDPAHGTLQAQVPLDGTPDAVAADADAVWVTDRDRNVVSRIDPSTHTIRQTISVGHGPTAIALTRAAVWVANSQDGTVSVISPRTYQVVQPAIPVGRQVDGLCAGDGGVWVASPLDYAVVRLDPQTGRRTARVNLDSQPSQLACGHGVVWASSPTTGTMTQISATAAAVLQTVQVPAGTTALAADGEDVWLANSGKGTVSRVDSRSGSVTAIVLVGREDGPRALAVTPGAVWVANEFDGTIAKIDRRRERVVSKFAVGSRPRALAAVGGALWLAVADAGASRRGGTVTLDYVDLPTSWADVDRAAVFYYDTPFTSDGLTGYAREGGTPTLVADLATAVPTPSDGGRTYAFRVRPGIRYSTGQIVRASDFRFGIERSVAQRQTAYQYLSAIRGAPACRPRACDLSRGIVVDDAAGTIVFHLSEPDADLLYKLALPFASPLPPSVGMSVPAKGPLPATGPYRIVALRPGRELRLGRNPEFRSWSPVVRPDGYPDAIVWRDYHSTKDALARVRAGKVDIFVNLVERLSAGVIPVRRAAPELLRDSLMPQTTWFTLNTKVAPFDNLDARRAVAFAFDRRATVRAIGGSESARASCQILPPDLPGGRPYCPFTSSGDARGAPEIARARRLVERSGTRGARVVVQSYDVLTRRVPEVMVRTLRSLGYRASLRILTVNRHFSTLTDPARRVQVGVMPWIADLPTPSAFLSAFSCAGIPTRINPSQFCDHIADRMMARAKSFQLTDPARSNALWSRAEHYVVDQAPMVSAFNFFNTDLVASTVGDYQFNWVFLGPVLDQIWVR